MNIQEFIEKHNLTLDAQLCKRNPNMPDFKGVHFEVSILKEDRNFTIYYSKGSGHITKVKRARLKNDNHIKEFNVEGGTIKVELREILYCVKLDISCVEGSFNEFCNTCGYDTDSRNAYRVYEAILGQKEDLELLLGTAAFTELINEVQDE